MRINKVEFNELQTSEVGLKAINLDRLGTIVALIGKNGSGKSRILNFLEKKYFGVATLMDILKENISEAPKEIMDYMKKIEPYKPILLKQELLNSKIAYSQKRPGDANLKSEIKSMQREIIKLEQSLLLHQTLNPTIVNNPQRQNLIQHNKLQSDTLIKDFEPIISKVHQNYFKRVNYTQIRQLQEAISEKGVDANSFEDLIESVSEQIDYNEFGSVYKSSLHFLKKLPHQLVDDWIECLGDKTKFEKRIAYLRFKALKEIFEKIMGKTLDWEKKIISKKVTDEGVESTSVGIWKINDREFNYNELSDGEKTLFAYVLLFFLMSQNRNLRLKDSIIIIDEPEIHLHPDAEIDLINGIREIIEENGQLWIATHSINILSHLSFDEIFMVKDNEIKRPSSTIQREALSELMKIDDRVQKLTEFLTSISNWSFVHFMFECFTNPDVIEVAKENDPQVTSLKEIITLSSSNKKNLFLDFGAGKGRLFEQGMMDARFNSVVEYSALEPNSLLHKFLTSKGVKKIYSKYDELEDNSFDFIVLCNVLHEIKLEEWMLTLNKIIKALNASGSLIIIEAKKLTKGEQVGVTGFLLLNELEIQKLFDLSQLPISLKHKDFQENITCVLIPKAELSQITNDNILNAMKALENSTFEKIEELRNSTNYNTKSAKIGRQSAFLSQLYINSKLAQKFLIEQSNKAQKAKKD